MSLSIYGLYLKEVKDIARDRRTLITNLLVPIILMPCCLHFLGGGMEKMEEDIENITIALTEQSDTEEIRELLENEVFADFPNVKINGSVKDPKAAVQNKDARFVLEVDSNFSDLLQQGKTYNITVHYDQNDTKSVGGFSIIAQLRNTAKNRLKSGFWLWILTWKSSGRLKSCRLTLQMRSGAATL